MADPTITEADITAAARIMSVYEHIISMDDDDDACALEQAIQRALATARAAGQADMRERAEAASARHAKMSGDEGMTQLQAARMESGARVAERIAEAIAALPLDPARAPTKEAK